MTTLAPAAAAPTRLLSRARFTRRRATTSPARVVVRPRAATPQQPFWDNGPAPEDDRGPAHRGFTPVPGFGEYYNPPAAPKTKSPDGTPQPAPRRRSKLIDEPTAPSVWSPGDVGSAAAPVGDAPPARGAFSRALDVVVGRTPDPPIAEATGYPQSRGNGEYDHDHDYDYDYAQPAVPGPDEELARLRSMYRLLRRMAGALRFLFPVTGGLACWVAAGASFGGAFTTFIPFMVNAVNVLAFALASVVGAAMFTGGYILVALLARTLRLALFGDARGDVVDRAPPPYQYPTLPAPRETPRAKDPTYEVYEVETRGYAYDEPRGRSGAGTGSGTGAGTYAASASAREPEPAEVASETEPEVDDGEPFAARPPPKRKRVDLPIETLIGLGEGALVSVGSEWSRQRGYADNGRGKSTTNGRSTETKTETETRRGSEENARRQPPRENAAPAPVARAPARTPAPPPAPAPAPAPPPPPPPPARVAEERAPVSWDPAALMKDMGFGDDASSPSPAAASRPAEKEEKKGGWFGGWFGGGGQPEPDPTPPPQQPQTQTQRQRPAPRASSADDVDPDPVMAMLSGGANANPNATNPNAARAAAAAAAPPSGRNFVEQASSTTGGGGSGGDDAAEWAEMRARRDEWNRRVQRTVRKQQDEGDEEES